MKVIGQTLNPYGSIEGTYNHHLQLNTLTHNVQFPESENKAYFANIVAQNLMEQLQDNCFLTLQIDSIVNNGNDKI